MTFVLRVPEFYIMPERRIESDIVTAHDAYLAKHGGGAAGKRELHAPCHPNSACTQWLERWDVLGIFGPA